LLDWAMQDGLFRIQSAFDGVLQNFPNRFAALMLRALIFPLGQSRKPPSDEVGHDIATILSTPGKARDRLTAGGYIPSGEDQAVGALEAALSSTLLCEPMQAELVQARKAGKLKSLDEEGQIAEAKAIGLLTAVQAEQLKRDYALRRKVIMVDDFAA